MHCTVVKVVWIQIWHIYNVVKKYIAQITRHVHFLPHSLGNVAEDEDGVQDRIPHGRDLFNTLLCRMVKMLPIEPIFSMFMSDLVFFLDFLIWVLSVAVRLVCLQTPICISSACKLCLHRYNWRNVDCLQVCVNSQHNFVSREINNCVGHTRGAWTCRFVFT